MLLSTYFGRRSTVFSKDNLDSLLISTHFTDLEEMNYKFESLSRIRTNNLEHLTEKETSKKTERELWILACIFL